MRSGFIDVDGNRVFYYQYGEKGPKIVLLHGFGHFAHALNFRIFLENMSDSYQVFALDLLGHGKSSDPITPIGFEEHARIIHQAVVELGYLNYSLIGYSFGGRISMRLASMYGEFIERLVLVDIVPRCHEKPQHVTVESGIPKTFKSIESAVDWISDRYPSVPREFWYSYLDSLFFRDEDGAWSMSSHPLRKKQMVMDGDGWLIIKNINVPSMIVRGSESNVAVLGEVNRMKEVMSDLVVVSIDGADHNVPFTHPVEFEKAIRKFIPI